MPSKENPNIGRVFVWCDSRLEMATRVSGLLDTFYDGLKTECSMSPGIKLHDFPLPSSHYILLI